MPAICVINGHPDPSPERLCAGLSAAYVEGAVAGGHTVSHITVGALEFGFLSGAAAFATPPPEPILSEREKLARADHVVFVFPLWLGAMPAKTRAFLEHAARGEFFLETGKSAREWPRKMMAGKSARLIVTMAMPGLVYSLLLGAHSLKGVEQGVLGMSGFNPVRHTVIGGVGTADAQARAKWLTEARALGVRAG